MRLRGRTKDMAPKTDHAWVTEWSWIVANLSTLFIWQGYSRWGEVTRVIKGVSYVMGTY